MIGQAIKAARKAAGLTQEDLANEIGVKRAVISKYENGQIAPKYQTVELIAKALNCSVSDLVNPKNEAQMIIDNFIDEFEAGPFKRKSPFFISTHGDEINDAFAELNQPGIIAQRYTRFIAEHPLIMQTLKEIGVELEIIDWRKIRIKYDYHETEERTSELLSDLESLHENFVHSIKDLFKNNYGFDMSEED